MFGFDENFSKMTKYLNFLGNGADSKATDDAIRCIVLKAIKLYNLPCPKFFMGLVVDIDQDKQTCFRAAIKEELVGSSDGDSGGPLIYYSHENRRRYLTGIASLSSESSDSPFIDTVFTSADYFSDCIQDIHSVGKIF